MVCKAENPTRHLLALIPLVFEPRKLDDGNMLNSGQFVFPPLDFRPVDIPEAEHLVLNLFAGWIEYIMDYAETVVRWEAFEIGLDRESLGVPPAHVFEGA